jgi:tetratricopeptide (TPR) repeat protein
MPPRKPQQRSRSKLAPTRQLSPAEEKKLADLLMKLHESINTGQAKLALPKLEELKEKFPQNINVLVMLARAYFEVRMFPECHTTYRKALKQHPEHIEINFLFALALENSGKIEHALDRYDLVLSKKPNHFYAIRNRCAVLLNLQRADEAFHAYQELLEKFAEQDLTAEKEQMIVVTAALFAPDRLDAQECIDDIKVHLQGTASVQYQKLAHAHLGRLYKHLKNYDETIDHYQRCKDLDRQNWNPDDHSTRVDQLIACWTKECTIPATKYKAAHTRGLIFIVGMPRSGTSLTEQMLAQINGVVPGGELNAIDRQLPFAERPNSPHAHPWAINASLYTQNTIDKMAKNAIKVYNDIDRKAIITDKQPYNYAFVPLIARMFPGAKFIHTKRDAMDCCLSNLTTSFNEVHMHAVDQYWLGRYQADYERLMDAWSALPEVNMIDLQYEELVEDSETQMRRVVDFLGLEWTDEILDFHKSDRTIQTASREQVRQPVYRSSVKRYLPYEHRLGELKRGIEEGRSWAPGRSAPPA